VNTASGGQRLPQAVEREELLAANQRRQHHPAGVVQGFQHEAVQPSRRGRLPGRH